MTGKEFGVMGTIDSILGSMQEENGILYSGRFTACHVT